MGISVKILLFVRDCEVTTQRRGAILCSRSQKFGKHCLKQFLFARLLWLQRL